MAQASTWRVMVNFTANNMTGSAFSSLLSSISSAHKGTQNLTAAMNALKIAAGGALVEFGKTGVEVFTKSAEAAGNLQQQLVLMKQTLGAMGDTKAMAGLAQQRALLTTGSNPVLLSNLEVAGIQRSLLGAGISGSDISRGGSSSLGVGTTYMAEIERARGMGTPDSTAANIAGFLKGYGISGGDTVKAIDTLQKAQSMTNHFSTDYLRYGEQYAGQTARALKISPQDFVMALGMQAQVNIGASKAGVNLNDMLIHGITPGGMTNAEMDARRTTLAKDGLLGVADPAKAGRMLRDNEAAFHKANYNVDAKSLSPRQREALASYMLSESSTSVFQQRIKSQGLIGGATSFMGDILKSETTRAKKFGMSDTWRDQEYLGDVLKIFGAQGERDALTFGPNAKKYVDQVNNQKPMDKVISELRGTLPGQEQFAQSRMTDILIGLGGVDSKTGIAIKGGPLDTLQKIMTEVNKLLTAIDKFVTEHPDTAAHIGTLIGGLGVAAVVGGTALAGAGVLGLASSAMGVGGRLVGSTAMRGIGSFLGDTVGKLFAHPSGAQVGDAFHWAVGSPFRQPGSSRFAKNIGAFGGRGPNIYRGAASAGHDLIDALPDGVKNFGDMLGKFLVPTLMNSGKVILEFGSRLLGIVGWVMLVVDALKFFRDHPKDIADFIANILIFFRDKLIPGIEGAFLGLLKSLIGYFKDALEMLKPTNWYKFGDAFKALGAEISRKLSNESRYVESQKEKHKHQGKPAPKHAGDAEGHGRQRTRETATHHTHVHLDGKEITHVVDKHQNRNLKASMRASTGGLGVPGISFSATGLA